MSIHFYDLNLDLTKINILVVYSGEIKDQLEVTKCTPGRLSKSFW